MLDPGESGPRRTTAEPVEPFEMTGKEERVEEGGDYRRFTSEDDQQDTELSACKCRLIRSCGSSLILFLHYLLCLNLSWTPRTAICHLVGSIATKSLLFQAYTL